MPHPANQQSVLPILEKTTRFAAIALAVLFIGAVRLRLRAHGGDGLGGLPHFRAPEPMGDRDPPPNDRIPRQVWSVLFWADKIPKSPS